MANPGGRPGGDDPATGIVTTGAEITHPLWAGNARGGRSRVEAAGSSLIRRIRLIVAVPSTLAGIQVIGAASSGASAAVQQPCSRDPNPGETTRSIGPAPTNW